MNFFEDWDSKKYLLQYYNHRKLVDDEILVFKFIYSFLKKQKKISKMLEFGSGPTIHRTIPFVPYVDEIYIADYLKSNLTEIDNWLKSSKESHNWDYQIQDILAIENSEKKQTVTRKEVAQRIRELKSKKLHLIKCDIYKKNPLLIREKFPLISSFYCADSITSDKKEWKMAMRNLLSLVENKGYILLSALRKTNKYKVGEYFFPSPNLHEDDFADILKKNGFPEDQIKIQIIPANNWQNQGIDSLIMLSAKKDHS